MPNDNPLGGITEGLVNAFSLANMIHRQRIDDQSIQLQKQRESDVRQENQSREERQNADLSMRLNAMGARQATPSDDLEAQTGTKVNLGSSIEQRLQGGQADGSDPSLNDLPSTRTSVNPKISFSPSDIKSRQVKVGGKNYIMPSQDEQDARTAKGAKTDSDAAVAKAEALNKVGKIILRPSEEDRKTHGLPEEIPVDPAHLAQYIASIGQERLTDTGPAAQAAGMPAKVPFKNLPSVVSSVNAALGRKSQSDTADKNREAANTRAKDANASRERAAGMRRDTSVPTANAAGVESRFDQRRQDAAEKQMGAVQAKEDEVHAARTKLGADLQDPKLPEAQRTAKTAQLKMTAIQVQSYQSRKAKIAGAQVPPKAIQDQIPEGHELPAPDGHVWRKQGGIVYFVQ